MRRLWVVSYDISDSARRTRLAHYLLGWGNRVLESVFECVWRADQMPTVQRELAGLIDPGTDRVWLVPLCRRCRQGAQVNGQHRRCDAPAHHVV
jgi:CRISPR-associated protein Cas2